MPGTTIIAVIGSWLLLAVLSVLAYRFNRNRSDD
jgi:hypothetical protein